MIFVETNDPVPVDFTVTGTGSLYHVVNVMPEKISAAAVRCNGDKVFTGANHLECWMKITQLAVDEKTKADYMTNHEDGFVTSSGRFVDREEAFHIAKHNQQIKAAAQTAGLDLSDENVNRDFYQQDRPRLDSGMVESYAPLLVVMRNPLAEALVEMLLED